MPNPPLHIIFAGTPAFAVPSLETLAGNPAFSVDLVITQPDKPVGRKGIITPPPIKIVAERLNIRIWQPTNINTEIAHCSLPVLSRACPELRRRVEGLLAHCDYCIAVAYGQILSEHILSLPRIAPVNVHASLLPRWRGASPMQHAILAGDPETGITVQRMVKTLDAGPILAQERTSIGSRETFTELHDRLSIMGGDVLIETLLAEPKPDLSPVALAKGEPQPNSGITVCKKLTRASGLVDPQSMTAEEIDRRVRALTPWPGVTLPLHNASSLKILATDLQPAIGAIPLPCKHETTLYLVTVQPSGGTPMTGEAWERGKRA